MTQHDSIVDALARTDLFGACPRRELRAISRAATVVDVQPDVTLMTEGRPGHDFVIVLEGVATITAGDRVVATAGPGDHFGEMALLDDGPRTATVTTATPMTLAVLGRREFNDLLEKSPVLTRSVLASLARRLREHGAVPAV